MGGKEKTQQVGCMLYKYHTCYTIGWSYKVFLKDNLGKHFYDRIIEYNGQDKGVSHSILGGGSGKGENSSAEELYLAV